MAATFYVQSNSEKMYYEMLWSSVIPSATTIATSTWTISPVGPTLSDTSIDGLTTIVKIAGMTLGQDYVIKNHIVLSNEEEYDSSIFIFAEAK